MKYNPNYNSVHPRTNSMVKLIKSSRNDDRRLSFIKDLSKEYPNDSISISHSIINETPKVIEFSKYTPRTNLLFKESEYDVCVEPHKLTRNMSVPIFKKMTSREGNNKKSKELPHLIDYHPNYEVIFPKRLKVSFEKNNYELKKMKKHLLRKLCGSFSTPSSYIVVTELNQNLDK